MCVCQCCMTIKRVFFCVFFSASVFFFLPSGVLDLGPLGHVLLYSELNLMEIKSVRVLVCATHRLEYKACRYIRIHG